MKIKIVMCALVVVFASAIVCSAQPSAHMGTWKLNEAKSHFAKGATKNHTVVYEAAGDQTKVTVDGTDASGGAVDNEWTGKIDGECLAGNGSPTSNVRAYPGIHKGTLSIRWKQ